MDSVVVKKIFHQSIIKLLNGHADAACWQTKLNLVGSVGLEGFIISMIIPYLVGLD